MSLLSVEPGTTTDVASCEMCGDDSRSVSGLVRGDLGETAYVVQWTLGKIEQHGAHFDLLMARDPAPLAVAIEFRATRHGPAFMVVDARDRAAWARFPGATRLARQAVIGTPLAETVFAVLDAIWLQDVRILELHDSAA